MDREKKLKVIIFENDQILLNRFKAMFDFKGHDVLSYTDPAVCPLFANPQCNCPKDSPCADILIAGVKVGTMSGIEFFQNQRKKGCKASDRNKLLLGGDLTPEQQTIINNLGCGFIKKPFNEYEVAEWIEFNAQSDHYGFTSLH